mmetsp:Transcript_44847/g.144234  ORF Transcript_44847/g.144234 Transcript_44847/m.144234 type:complete len:101 (-) Transcript_44847:2389-2691(-)
MDCLARSQYQRAQLVVCSSRRSCEMTTTPPSKPLIPSTSASTDSMSRWFVGSSSRSTCGRTVEIAAKATRAFWPPDRSLILRSWAEEGSPFSPSSCRTCW